MIAIESYLEKRLEERRQNQSLRRLSVNQNLIDFCSNDYLGFAQSEVLARKIQAFLQEEKLKNGSTGSRLISGHSPLAVEVEKIIALFHQTESALLFNSGYDANIGLLSCLPTRHDTIIYDALSHASIRDGIRLASAKSFSFKHNDVMDLSKKMLKSKGQIWVIVESIYSMDGDAAPLEKIAALCKQNNAALIIDEAHATGVFGNKGEGLVQALQLQKKVFARIHTFGKALGGHGAAVVGSQKLIDYLINFARSFIYTTALPPHSLLSIKAAYQMLKEEGNLFTDLLKQKQQLFIKRLSPNVKKQFIQSESAIQSWIIGGNEKTRQVALKIQEKGFDVRAILHPTVPKGEERLRICLHAFNSDEELIELVELINGIDVSGEILDNRL